MTRNRLNGTMKNKDMNNDVYKLRRQVMNHLYAAKKIHDFPRVDVRITDRKGRLLGQARMNDYIIWIPEDAINATKYNLRSIVYHEILHAVKGQEHIDGCPLMDAVHDRTITQAKSDELFKKYMEA